MTPETRPGRGFLPAISYVALVVVPVALVLVLLGDGPTASVPSGGAAHESAPSPYLRLFLVLPLILLTCHLAATAFLRIGQPEVVGQIFAGILLGPSLLGLAWPAAMDWLFPSFVVGPIGVLANLGLVIFMYFVGNELDLSQMRGLGRTVVAVSHAGIALPMLAGVLIASGLYGRYAPDTVSFMPFALFIAVALSITAVPVLARILEHRRLQRTRVGTVAITSAVSGDVVAWSLLAIVVAAARSTSAGGAAVTFLLALAFGVLMVTTGRRLLTAIFQHVTQERLVLPLLLGGVLLSAAATEAIGIHAIFGAFLFGAVMPRDLPAVNRTADRIRTFTTAFLLPLFFVHTGLRTEIGAIGGDGSLWLWCAVVVVVAVVTKFGAAAAAARAGGMGWQESASLGALMNCRGLTELVVLNIGLDLGLISPAIFTIFVTMALISTAMTCPALDLIERWGRRGSTSEAAAPVAVPADASAR